MTRARSNDATARKRRSWRKGRWAETLCAIVLMAKGYTIVARNLRTPVGEIDLVARRGALLAVVEVKARPDLASALAAVRPKQQRRIERATQALLKSRADLAGLDLRFDVMVVGATIFPHHLKDAWRP